MDLAFEDYEKYTTLMYRPPEMCDRYKNYEVTTKVDIWMVGCVAFTLCCGAHPFQTEERLAIINSNYTFPKDKPITNKMKDFIRWCLTPNPSERPNICNILAVLDNYENTPEINLPASTLAIKLK
jgi:AP2-associated kinase